MNKLVLALLLCSSIAAVLAQKPVPCTTPPQWEARLFQYDVEEKFMIRAHLTYDALYQRERVFEEYQLGAEDDFFDTLSLYAQKVQYQFNLKTKQCIKKAITRPWRNYGIPANGTNVGESYIGSSAIPNANVLTTSWFANVTDDQGNKLQYYGTWTLEGCLPVESTVVSDAFGILHSYFFDITPGIEDPNAFFPRPECLNL